MRTQITRRIAKLASLTALVSILFLTILAAGKLASSLPASGLTHRTVRHSLDTAPEADYKNSAGGMHSALPQSQGGEKKKVINLAEVADKERNLPPDDEGGDDPPDNTPLPFDRSFPSQAQQHNERLSAESSPYKLSAQSPLLLFENFLALEDSGTPPPPDTHGAVGHGFLMATLNNRVRVQNRSGSDPSTVRLKSFWSFKFEGIDNVFDPRVTYDHDEKRWIFIAAANRPRTRPDGTRVLHNSAILIGVSENSNPRGNWHCSLIDADPVNEQNSIWADFPTIGFNKDWIVVQAKMLRTSDDSFAKSQILVFNKMKLYDGDYAGADDVLKRFDDPNNDGWVPAVSYEKEDEKLDKLYLIRTGNANNQGRSNHLQIKWIYWKEVEVNGKKEKIADFSTETIVAQSQESWNPSPGDPDSAPQLSSPHKIATNDHRMQSVVYRNGSLWCAHSVFLDNPKRSSVLWWQIKPDGPDVVQQNGLIDEPDGRYHYAFPSLAVNKNEDVLIGYSRFSANQYASAYYSFRKGSDSPNTVGQDSKLKEGEAPYYRLGGRGRNRWGDYSSTVVDPENDEDLWTIQEYAEKRRNNKDRWGAWWGRIRPSGAPDCQVRLESTTPYGTPDGSFIGSDGFTLNVRVVQERECGGRWETENDYSWIKVISGHTGSGNGMVTIIVEPNDWPEPRVGSLTIADKTYTITQLASCIALLSDYSERFPPQGGSKTVDFRERTCAVTPHVDPTVDWVKAEITGNGFKYTVEPNKTINRRETTVLISGHKYRISQDAGKADDLALLALPPSVDRIVEAPISYAIGNKVYWVFPNTHHNFSGVPLAVGVAGVAIAFEGDRNNPTRSAPTAPKLFLPFTAEEEATNQSDPEFFYRLYPRSAVDDGNGGVIIFYEKLKIKRNDTVFGGNSVGFGIASVRANNPMVAVREPELMPEKMFTGDKTKFGLRATVRGEMLYVYAARWVGIFTRELRVARAPLSQAANKSAYEAWDGSKWNQDINKAAPTGYFGGEDPSIAWNAFLGKFVAVIREYQSNRVLIHTASNPEGPWPFSGLSVTGLPPKTVGQFNGGARLHPIFFTDLGRTIMLSYQQPKGVGLLSFFGDTQLATAEFAQPVRAEESFDKLKGKRVMVALVFGQANSANHGELGKSLMTAQQDVFCLNKGMLTRCVDPLTGASGKDGSVWTRLGGRIIDEGLYDAVVFIPIGEAGSEIARWAPGGDLHQRILDAALMVRQHDLMQYDLKMFWHQGESDAGKISRADYKARFEAMLENLRKNGIDAPIYVSVASRCYANPGDPEIQQAQRELVDPSRNIFVGPNTDCLDNSFRYDDCHFSNAGLEEFARLWVEQLGIDQLKLGRRIAARCRLSRRSDGRAIQ